MSILFQLILNVNQLTPYFKDIAVMKLIKFVIKKAKKFEQIGTKRPLI